MCGSHPRHLYVANELYKAGFLKALVIEKRESFNPRPNPAWSDKDKELFINHFKIREEYTEFTYDQLHNYFINHCGYLWNNIDM